MTKREQQLRDYVSEREGVEMNDSTKAKDDRLSDLAALDSMCAQIEEYHREGGIAGMEKLARTFRYLIKLEMERITKP